MKTRVYKGEEDRTILTALIVNDVVLGRIYSALHDIRDPFRSKWANIIARWCFEYYKRYQRSPRQLIQAIFNKFSEREPDEDAVKLVEAFLTNLSEEHSRVKHSNEKYLIDLAASYFEKIQLQRTAEAVQTALENGNLEEARNNHNDYKPISFSSQSWTDPFKPDEIFETLRYYEEDRSVLSFPGDLGRFLDPHMERDAFVSFCAPEKKGKSFWLQECVWQGIKQRRRVLYYVLGDMSLEQVKRRLYVRSTLRPLHDKRILYPTRLRSNGLDEHHMPQCLLKTQERDFTGLTAGTIKRAAKKILTLTASRQIRLRLRCAGASVVSASDIEKDVREFTRQGWVPDIVVLDYADLLAPEPFAAKQEYRHQINETWKVLRRISLDCHLLMLTATQAAARSYDAPVIRKKDFSEDKRKNAHVTGMLGINQNSDEKKQGLYRLNWVFLRDGEWTDSQVCWTAGSLSLACPCLKSAL